MPEVGAEGHEEFQEQKFAPVQVRTVEQKLRLFMEVEDDFIATLERLERNLKETKLITTANINPEAEYYHQTTVDITAALDAKVISWKVMMRKTSVDEIKNLAEDILCWLAGRKHLALSVVDKYCFLGYMVLTKGSLDVLPPLDYPPGITKEELNENFSKLNSKRNQLDEREKN